MNLNNAVIYLLTVPVGYKFGLGLLELVHFFASMEYVFLASALWYWPVLGVLIHMFRSSSGWAKMDGVSGLLFPGSLSSERF